MKNILSIFLTIGCILGFTVTQVPGQAEVDIQGTVKDKYTGDPVSGAEVTLAGRDLTAPTDADGRFSIVFKPAAIGLPPSGCKRPRFVPAKGIIFTN